MRSAHNVPHCDTYRARRTQWSLAYRMAVRPYIEFAEGKHIDKNSLQEQKSIFLLSQSGRMARRRCRLGVQKGACGTPVAMPPVEDALLPKTDESLCVGGRLKTKTLRNGRAERCLWHPHIEKNHCRNDQSIFPFIWSGRMARRRCRLSRTAEKEARAAMACFFRSGAV